MAHRQFLQLEKDGKNIQRIFSELRETAASPLHAIKALMAQFPELTLVQAKEIMVISETDYRDLREYQEDIFAQLAAAMAEDLDEEQ